MVITIFVYDLMGSSIQWCIFDTLVCEMYILALACCSLVSGHIYEVSQRNCIHLKMPKQLQTAKIMQNCCQHKGGLGGTPRVPLYMPTQRATEWFIPSALFSQNMKLNFKFKHRKHKKCELFHIYFIKALFFHIFKPSESYRFVIDPAKSSFCYVSVTLIGV